jgi:molecular chaperone DnaK (HSP70)
MIIEATKFNEADENGKEAVETRNRAAAVIYATQKLIGEASGKISEREKRSLEEASARLKVALDSSKHQGVKECTDELRELIAGVKVKLKKVGQAEALLSSVERKLGDRLSSEEKRKIRKALKRLEDTPYSHVNAEIIKLKEMAILLEADCGEG